MCDNDQHKQRAINCKMLRKMFSLKTRLLVVDALKMIDEWAGLADEQNRTSYVLEKVSARRALRSLFVQRSLHTGC